jgi:hypothetical protein
MPAPADRRHQRPSEVEVHQPGGAEPHGHPAFPPPLRRGQTLTDRDQVDVVPSQTSTSAAATLPVPKNADAVPSPAASSLPGISGILPLAYGLPPAVATATLPFRDLSQRRTCGSDAPRRPVADRTADARGTRPLVDQLLPARGRHPHLFRSRMAAARRGSPPRHSIYPIAIRRRRPCNDRVHPAAGDSARRLFYASSARDGSRTPSAPPPSSSPSHHPVSPAGSGSKARHRAKQQARRRPHPTKQSSG